MSTSKELGKAIQYYSDTHEQGGDAWLICKLNDVVNEVKELEDALKYVVETSQLKTRGNDKLVKDGLAIHGEPMCYISTLSAIHAAKALLGD